MLSLSDTQLRMVMAAAASLEPARRSQFLERLAAMLAYRGRGHFSDDDVADAAQRALTGLVHTPAA